MSEPIAVIYESDDLRAIADLMDKVSKYPAPLRVEGEAFVIERYETSGPGPDDGPHMVTVIEFKMGEIG